MIQLEQHLGIDLGARFAGGAPPASFFQFSGYPFQAVACFVHQVLQGEQVPPQWQIQQRAHSAQFADDRLDTRRVEQQQGMRGQRSQVHFTPDPAEAVGFGPQPGFHIRQQSILGDGVATMVSGAAGGTGVTTYAENIGVMAATRIYSTAMFVVAALVAILLGFSPKFGALIHTIPLPVMGGVSIVIFGLITIAGARIWVDNKVDFLDSRNMMVAAITLVLGTGDFTLSFGGFSLGGIGTATFGAILLNAVLNYGKK